MRTTIRLNDDLLARAKEAAAKSGRTLSAVVEDALRQWLSPKNAPVKRRAICLPSSGKGGLRPGVNLDSTAELLDIMDRGDPSAI
jgi:plasmid stability protein